MKVRAINGSKKGSWSSTKTFATKAKTPAKVTGLQTSSVTANSFKASWSKASNAKKYQIAYKKASASKWSYKTTTSKSATLSSLSENTKYQVKVRAANTGAATKWGAWSSTKTLTTKINKAFAVYSKDDNSLTFYKRTSVPKAGDKFNGKTASAVYTGIESTNEVPWEAQAENIKSVTVADKIAPTNMEFWFDGFSICKTMNLTKIDTANVTNMRSMLGDCGSLTTVGDISKWNTSKVTDMDSMFSWCSKLTSLNLSSWNTSKVTDMRYMFSGCKSLTTVGDLSKWDTSQVKYTYDMFSGCASLTSLDLSGWDTSNVTDMGGMFNRCTSLTTVGDLSKWDISNAFIAAMFGYCESLESLDLSSWDTSNVTYMDGLFYGCTNLTTVGDLSKWDISNVEHLNEMFYGCENLTTVGDVSKWNTSKAETMLNMFYDCPKLTINCSSWNVSNVTSYSGFNTGSSNVIAPTWVEVEAEAA